MRQLLDFDFSDETMVLTNEAKTLRELRESIDEIMLKELHDNSYRIVKQWHQKESSTNLLMHRYAITAHRAIYFINVFVSENRTDYHLQYCYM